ncbi:hypothetical protein Plhal703r1_c66g0169061 [Plasmopara halstedii]
MGAVDWFRAKAENGIQGKRNLMMATNSVANEPMLHAKGLLQQTVVTKLCPIVQLRLSPLPSEYNNNVKQTEDNFFPEPKVLSGLDAKWLTTEASEQFAKQVLCMVSDSKCTFQMTSEGCGGAIRQGNAVVGVTEHPVNKGFRVGNGAFRERAAYLLDSAYGNFSGVPETNVMVLNVNGCSADDMGTLNFAIPEVHKIGILDVRLLIRTATPAIFY